MNKTDRQAFVLWGNGFDAPAAAIFASRLRQLGISVTIVGIQGAMGVDTNGIRLQADTTLGEALNQARNALALIIPCTASRLKKAENDPRLFQLFQRAITPTTFVVVRSLDVLMQISLVAIDLQERYLLYESDHVELPVVQKLANRLTL